MTELGAHGINVNPPPGWEGRVFRRPSAGEVGASAVDGPAAPHGESTHAVVHVATIPLPSGLGDFGSAAVPALGPDDAFVMLVEFDPADAGKPLFATAGVPRSLRPEQFSPQVMQRRIDGQAGCQIFCNEAGRAFCLYVVIGSYQNRERSVPRVNEVLATLAVSGAGAGAATVPSSSGPTTSTTTAPTPTSMLPPSTLPSTSTAPTTSTTSTAPTAPTTPTSAAR